MKDIRGQTNKPEYNKRRWNHYKRSKCLASRFGIDALQRLSPAKKSRTIGNKNTWEPPASTSPPSWNICSYIFPPSCCCFVVFCSGSTSNQHSWRFSAPFVSWLPWSCEGEWSESSLVASFSREGEWWGAASGDLARSRSTVTRKKERVQLWKWPQSEGRRQKRTELWKLVLERRRPAGRRPADTTSGFFTTEGKKWKIKKAESSLGNLEKLVPPNVLLTPFPRHDFSHGLFHGFGLHCLCTTKENAGKKSCEQLSSIFNAIGVKSLTLFINCSSHHLLKDQRRESQQVCVNQDLPEPCVASGSTWVRFNQATDTLPRPSAHPTICSLAGGGGQASYKAAYRMSTSGSQTLSRYQV